MNNFNNIEFMEICNKFNVQPYSKDVTVRYASDSYFNKVKDAVASDRRGEVVFCVIRPNGKLIAITCEEYPEGIFRIPTGGIGYGEDIIDAVFRETKEELGLKTEIVKFIGVLKIRFEHADQSVMFYSYMFILKEIGGKLLEDATDNEVSEAMEVSIAELESLVNALNNIQGQWSDWGKFRYETCNAVLQYLK